MKTLRFIVICAAPLLVGEAWAQDQPASTVTSSTTQDVGGTSGATTSESGSPLKMTQPSTYQTPMNEPMSGEDSRAFGAIYHGH